MISNRTAISLAQFLSLLRDEDFVLLCEKHNAPVPDFFSESDRVTALRLWIQGIVEESVFAVLGEILRNLNTVRSAFVRKYLFDEQWEDLVLCLALDGYRVDMRDRTIRPVDPTIPGAAPIEDDLTTELKKSGLPEAGGIITSLVKSADAFRQSPPDLNGSLTHARVALDTLARAIAVKRVASHPGTFDKARWGEVVSYLRKSGLITDTEEKGLAGVYSFVSPGAHVPVGLTQQEMVRLGRSLVGSMAYFLIKRYNGGP